LLEGSSRFKAQEATDAAKETAYGKKQRTPFLLGGKVG
jgi:hypothetical protein